MFTALVFTSPDLRFGRGGDDLVFPSAALEWLGLALDAIRAQPHIVRGLHSQHFKGADWLQHWRSTFLKLYELADAKFCPVIVCAFRN
jgi:hypothetical protein